MHSADETTRPRKGLPKWLVPAIGYAVSTACLIWVFLGVDWSAVLPDLVNLHWGWVILAVVSELLIYVVQAWRWNLLLRPMAKIPLLRSARAIYIGLFASGVLPLRPGEVIRAYLQAHWNDIPFGIALSSVVIERILDGIFLVLTFAFTAALVDLPTDLVLGGRIFGIGVLVVALLLGLIMFWKHKAHAAVSGSRWAVRLRHLVDGLHAMGNSPSFYGALAVSLLYSLVQIVPIYALMRAFGLDLSLWAAWVVLLVQRLGTVVPQMPGNLGTSQFFFIKALEMFGVGRADASNFSLIAFSTITLPLVLAGFIALSLAELDLFEIHRHAHSKLKHPPSAATQ
jgi:uncharacterized protein (TIRG00374 family)